ncbi:MAG: hypothetical protein ABI406_18445 [Ktedonobacteraceae bacterium]
MSYKQNSLAVNIHTNIHAPEDDIDTIFSQLQPVEPPPMLVARILAQLPQQASTNYFFALPLRESEISIWTTRTRQKNLC